MGTRKEANTIRVDLRSAESALSKMITRIDEAWREKRFDGLADCFHPDAVITGPGFVELAKGREACVESYREFAANAEILTFGESGHQLRVWDTTAVYTFGWKMSFDRGQGPVAEKGTDQMVFERSAGEWRMVWRNVHFEPAD
jgi:ketosteroid isomerase-like protein